MVDGGVIDNTQMYVVFKVRSIVKIKIERQNMQAEQDAGFSISLSPSLFGLRIA
jgi:hypothetical protein